MVHVVKTGLLSPGQPRKPGLRLACSRRWVRGCHRGHLSANRGSAAVNGSVAVGGSRQAGYGSTHFFRGIGSQCPSGMPELDRGMNFGGPALHMGVVPSLAMLSSSQRSIGACTKPGDAPLTGQRSTEELR